MINIDCSYDEMLNISKIKPHPKNNNRHPKEQIERLCKIIEYQGFRQAIVISKLSGFITKGHGRLQAAKKLGMKKIPVNYQEYENESQEYADLTADNEIARWAELDLDSILDNAHLLKDLDVDMLGIEDLEIPDFENIIEKKSEHNEMVRQNKENERDNLIDLQIPDVNENEKVITNLGDIWILESHRLMCGDSTDLKQVKILMNKELADLWIADPPFGVSYCEKNAAVNGGIVINQTGKEIKSDCKSVDELAPFWRDASRCAYEVTSMEASNYWCACQGSDKMMMMMMMMMDEAGWNIRHELIWVKSSFVFGRSDYHYRHEPIIYGWKKKGKHNWCSDRKQSSVFEIARPSRSDMHPTTKPVELFENFIINSTRQRHLVFESFGGSGTSIMACEKNSRRCNTMELDEKYCDVIVKRWQEYTGKKAHLESTGQLFDEIK